MKLALLVTCEHAYNQIPKEFKNVFIPKDILNSHFGFDRGAYSLAKTLYTFLPIQKKLFLYSKITRLLIDFNRSLENPKIFSRYSKSATIKQRKKLIQIYKAFRRDCYNFIIKFINKKYIVIHLSIHTFTPIFRKKIRKTEIGILYDPKSQLETAFAKKLKKNLRSYKCHLNLPYRGYTDGHTTKIRKQISKFYIGIELEINQKFIKFNKILPKLQRDIIQAVSTTLTTLQIF